MASDGAVQEARADRRVSRCPKVTKVAVFMGPACRSCAVAERRARSGSRLDAGAMTDEKERLAYRLAYHSTSAHP